MSGKQHYQVQWVQKDSNQQEKSRKSPPNRYNERKRSESGSDYGPYKEKSQEKNQSRNQERNQERHQLSTRDDRRDDTYPDKKRYNERKSTYNDNNYHKRDFLEQEEPVTQYSPHRDKDRNQTSFQAKATKKWRSQKQAPTKQLKQINDLENRCYDVSTLVKAFTPQAQFPQDLLKIQELFPSFFTKSPSIPLNIQEQVKSSTQPKNNYAQSYESQNKKHVYDAGSDPEWMQETAKIEEVNFEAFDFKNIENLLDEKRAQYQKGHGTFERKQREKEEKLKIKEEKDIIEKQVQMEKQSYKLMKEQKEQKQMKNLVSDLFNVSIQNEKQDQHKNIMTLEQIELSMNKQFSSSSNEKQQAKSTNQSITVEANIMDFISGATQNNQESTFKNQWKPPQPQVQQPQIQQPQVQQITQRIPQTQLEQSPFSVHALLNSKKIQDALWYYVDQSDKIQGGFPSVSMDQWYLQKYLPVTLKISWLTPGQWITLEQFMINLELVNRGQLASTRAAEQTNSQPSQLPGFEYLMFMKELQKSGYEQQISSNSPFNQDKSFQYMKQQQQASHQDNGLYNQSNINILNNVIHINQPSESPYMQQNRNNQTGYEYAQTSNQRLQQIQLFQIQQQQQQQQQLQQQQQQQHQQQSQQQQLLQLQQQQQQQFQQSQQYGKRQAKKEEEKLVVQQQQIENLFNIGMKKQLSQQSQSQLNTSGQNISGIVLDSNEFPKLGEVKKADFK